jgi:SpoVK/Ycf46/Vps4 family AAA+-type ATPase
LGVLEVKGLEQKNDDRWQLIGTLATALHAMPVFVFDVAPGETIETPLLKASANPIGIVLGKQGGIAGGLSENAITLTLKMPDEEARREHWKQSFKHHQTNQLDLIAERFHITGGNIRRAAKLAVSYSALDDKEEITLSDVQQASRALNRQTLDTLAVRIETEGSDWNQLSVSAETMRELYLLESRCRYREKLRDEVGASFGKSLNSGVRALLCGASGTGKTLAARLLAASLQMDLYRLDLSTVVNKYIGETEKNLNRIFSRVEELDVILLLDEGDALLTSRTQVSNSNDRYANLETNYLLQRLESFEGILLVTTNAGDRIDSAFQRRMDVVIDFIPPSVYERRTIWQLHLPTHHTLSDSLLDEVARRCELTGGQIRNAVLHASTLALNQKTKIAATHLESALQREYKKLGAVCPVRLSATNGHYV